MYLYADRIRDKIEFKEVYKIDECLRAGGLDKEGTELDKWGVASRPFSDMENFNVELDGKGARQRTYFRGSYMFECLWQNPHNFLGPGASWTYSPPDCFSRLKAGQGTPMETIEFGSARGRAAGSVCGDGGEGDVVVLRRVVWERRWCGFCGEQGSKKTSFISQDACGGGDGDGPAADGPEPEKKSGVSGARKETEYFGVPLSRCGKCVKAGMPRPRLYCSATCQREDWDEHRAAHLLYKCVGL